MNPVSTTPQISPSLNLDEWLRHIVDIHFHPTSGAPFWVERARKLGIDARRDIRAYEDLSLLGFFPMDALRTRNVLDFLPVKLANDRSKLEVQETGGTTGPPARVAVHNFFEPITRWMDWYLDEVAGFPRGDNWLFIGPTGPHGVASSTRDLARLRGGMCYFIDLDPRFIKLLYQKQDMRTVGLYLEHIRRQAYEILDTQEVRILGTTPVLIQMLAPELKSRGYRFTGMMYGGTQLTRDLCHLLQTEYFPDAVHTAVYGNTLFGGALLAPVLNNDPNLVYYPLEPMVKLDVVNPEKPEKIVGLRETGQVRVSVLSEERFLPWILERDQAERWDILPALGWEGLANVRALAKPQSAMTEGVY